MRSASILCDTGSGAGLGHRGRMQALSTALTRAGVEVRTWSGDDRVEDDLLVVDSYRWRADEVAGSTVTVVAAVDDLERDLDVDLVVDPSPGASAEEHRAAGVVLAGARYALIDPALGGVPSADIGPAVGTVLVATGAVDVAGVGAALAEAILRRLPGRVVRLAVGPWGSQEVPAGVQAVWSDRGLAADLVEADLVVTGGGVTLLECLALGRPTVAVVLAENQRQAVAGAVAAGAAAHGTVDEAPDTVVSLVGDVARRRRLAAAGRTLVDGGGAVRVAEELRGLVS